MTALCEECGESCQGQHTFRYLNEDTIDSELRDPILLQPLVDPVDLPCTHTFSRASLDGCLKGAQLECPMCRRIFPKTEMRPSSLTLVKIVNRLPVSSPSLPGALGRCLAPGSMHRAPAHIDTCARSHSTIHEA